jgi:NAD(P)-dependent dehydrogenase (short-subunit alcohol dehydrogenase family)
MDNFSGLSDPAVTRDRKFSSMVVVVIGGNGLIGREIVRGLSFRGYQVILADINIRDAKENVLALCSSEDKEVDIMDVDITSAISINQLISDVQERYGYIDAVINSAYPKNSNYGNKVEDVTYEDFCENVSLHLGGYFLVSKLFCINFCLQGGGNLINLASIYGQIIPKFAIYKNTPMTMPIEYAAIKSGVIHITKYFAEYYKGNNMRANCLSPGGIYDNQPADFIKSYSERCNSKGMLDPRDLLGALYFLLSEDSKYFTGQNLIIDDGWSI